MDHDPESLTAKIGARLRAARSIHEVSQKEVAAALNTDAGTYCRYEAGTKQLTCEHVIRLTRSFGVSADWIFHGYVDQLSSSMRRLLTDTAPALVNQRPPSFPLNDEVAQAPRHVGTTRSRARSAAT